MSEFATQAEFDKRFTELTDLIRYEGETVNVLIDRIARMERLLDGVKDATLAVAQAVDPGCAPDVAGVFSHAARIIVAAQQPATVGEGAAVEVKS